MSNVRNSVIRVSESAHQLLKVKAAGRGISIGELVEELAESPTIPLVKSFIPTPEEVKEAELEVGPMYPRVSRGEILPKPPKAAKSPAVNKLTNKGKQCIHGRVLGSEYCSRCPDGVAQ